MKRYYTAAFAACVGTLLYAQVGVGGEPYGLRNALDPTIVPTVHPAPFDAEAVRVEDEHRAAAKKLPLYGRLLALNVDPFTAGHWTRLPNGDRLWRLRVVSEGAMATELYFNEFSLPNGGLLYVYDDAGEQVLGGFTAYNNKESGIFATALVDGEASTVEYYEPADVEGEGYFVISKVGHAYRWAGQGSEDRAGDCEVDVNCSPEGTGWTSQRDGTVRVGVVEGGGSGWCSGGLMNNTQANCNSYFLTAHHCGAAASTSDFQAWKFYFKYQRSGCGTGSASASKVMTGCVKRGESNDNGGSTGSDFLLLEADDRVPWNFNPFWLGWDANAVTHTGGKCIHHPAGDEKKISTFTGTTTNSTAWNGLPTHYRVVWAATTNGHGVTEGGSSGSPLFNNAKRVVGTLTGGSSYCNSEVPGGQTQPDFYGKMSYHWTSNGGPASEDLKAWLDPNNSGVLTLDGIPIEQCSPVGFDEFGGATAEAPGLVPNPAGDRVSVVYPNGIEHADRIEVLDITGRLLSSTVPTALRKADMDISALPAGAYLVRLVAAGRRFSAAKLEVAR